MIKVIQKKQEKKTKKDKKLGKATLIGLLGYKKADIYIKKLRMKIQKKLKIYGKKSNNLIQTIDYIIERG